MFAAIRWVRDGAHELEPTKRLVAMMLASFTDTTGTTSIGLRTLEQATGLSRKTVYRSIRALEIAGVLAVDRSGNGRRSTYRFPVESAPKLVHNRGTQSTPVRDDKAGELETPVGNDKAGELGTESGGTGDKTGGLWVPHVGKQYLKTKEGGSVSVSTTEPPISLARALELLELGKRGLA